jgi:hypothetical protein
MNGINDSINEAIDLCLKTGILKYDWNAFKEFLKTRLRDIDNDEQILQAIFRDLDKIDKIPFTIQRICELIREPGKYKNSEKFMFSFHKLVNLDN